MHDTNDRGLTLIEVCLAMLILLTAALGSARLLASTVGMITSARMQTSATVLAATRIEQLRAETWPLAVNAAGVTDYFDQNGVWVGSGGAPPASAVFITRAFVDAHPWDPADLRVLRVLATPVVRDTQAPPGPSRHRLADEASVTTVVARKVQ